MLNPTAMAQRRLLANLYNPHQQSKEQLINSFVVRLPKFRKIFQEIKQGTMENPEQHYLIVGQRGMGKTSLLLRLAYEIENDPNLNPWLIPLVFSEEQYAIMRLFHLWEETAKNLESKHPEFEGLFDQMDAQYADDPHRYEEICFQVLSEALTQAIKEN